MRGHIRWEERSAVSEVGGDGPLVAPLIWLGVGRATSERVDRFVAGLVWCFFPVGPVFWLIAHFVGGGWVLFAIWILLIAKSVQIIRKQERRRKEEGWDEQDEAMRAADR
jgi:hypothetical protein